MVCLRPQLVFRVDRLQVQVDVRRHGLEQLGNLNLRQSQRFVFKSALHTLAAILRLVEDDFRIGQRFVAHEFSLSDEW